MVVRVGHPADVVLDEALGAAVDLLEQVLGVERLEVPVARLADRPARRQVDQREHRGQRALGLGDGGQLGVDLRPSTGPAGRRRCRRGRRRRGAAFEATAAGPAVAEPTARAAGGAVKSINCWGPSTPTDLRTPASRCRTSGIACATAGDWAGGGPQRQHRLVELLDVLDQVLPLLGQPLHLRADRLVGLLEVAEAAPLLEHRPGLVGVELVAVLVEVPALDHQGREDRRDAHDQHHPADDRRELRALDGPAPTGLEPSQPAQDGERDRRRRQREQRGGDRHAPSAGRPRRSRGASPPGSSNSSSRCLRVEGRKYSTTF